MHVVSGGSAHRNGNVTAGDVVLAIDDTRVSGMTVDQVARLIVGDAGTFVRLGLSSPDKNKVWNVSLLRVQVEGGDGFYTGSDMSDDDCETYYEEEGGTPRSSGSFQVMKNSISDGFLESSSRRHGLLNMGESSRSLCGFDSEEGVDQDVSKRVIHVLREIVSTEKSYVRSIQVLDPKIPPTERNSSQSNLGQRVLDRYAIGLCTARPRFLSRMVMAMNPGPPTLKLVSRHVWVPKPPNPPP